MSGRRADGTPGRGARARTARGRVDGRPRGSTEIVVYGRRAVAEALSTDAVELVSVVATSRLAGDARKQIASACRERSVVLEACSAREMQTLSGDPRHDQGVAATLRLLAVRELEHFVAERRGPAAGAYRLLALDGITNSQNIGMIVRSAVAAGMDGLVWPLHDAPWINGLVVKASAGCVLRAPILRCDALPLALGELQGCGFEIVELAAASGQALASHRPAERAVYVVGSETAGVSDAVAGLADRCVHIPMASGVESLNAAVAASLVCFRVARTAV